MLLGNVIRGFHGGAVLSGNLIEVVLGCGWWRCARGKCESHCHGGLKVGLGGRFAALC